MSVIPTMKVNCSNSQSGYRVINKDDFDPARHEAFGVPKAKPAKAPVAKKVTPKAKPAKAAD
ncbi:MAG: hypothetical protein P1U50_01090 [Parvibaculaceae bacterium]|nr:hypothetical protein [Parvibaculaceae bacterium]